MDPLTIGILIGLGLVSLLAIRCGFAMLPIQAEHLRRERARREEWSR